jgi:hypothetical protein
MSKKRGEKRPIEEEEEELEDGVFLIDEIVEHKVHKDGIVYYNVKWKGESPIDCNQ